jgi:hypothetical protein
VSTLQATLERLKKLGTTVLYYSKRQDVQGFTHALEIDSEVQSLIAYAQEEK